jgi:hypothetical protein
MDKFLNWKIYVITEPECTTSVTRIVEQDKACAKKEKLVK